MSTIATSETKSESERERYEQAVGSNTVRLSRVGYAMVLQRFPRGVSQLLHKPILAVVLNYGERLLHCD
jgi:hypothetical protein